MGPISVVLLILVGIGEAMIRRGQRRVPRDAEEREPLVLA